MNSNGMRIYWRSFRWYRWRSNTGRGGAYGVRSFALTDLGY